MKRAAAIQLAAALTKASFSEKPMLNQTTETWRTIPETNGLYEASDYGRIRSVPTEKPTSGRQRGRVLKPYTGRKGYLQLRLCCGRGTSETIRVHKAVAAAFLGIRPEGLQVNHKDGNKNNNNPSNLEYVTCQENIRHAWSSGLQDSIHCVGVNNNFAKLTDDDVREVRGLESTMTRKELANKYNVTTTTVSNIINRKTWKHVS